MDDIVWLFLLIAGASLFERFMRAAKKKQQQLQQQFEHESEEAAEEGEGKAPTSLQELLAEELGLNLERRPKVRQQPQLPGTVEESAVAAPPPQPPDRVVYYPTPQETRQPRAGAAERGISAARVRRAVPAQHRAEVARRASHRPERLTLEERVALERGTPKSLERPRRPEDHERFHEEYAVPLPVSSHSEFHARYMKAEEPEERRRAGVRLPDRSHWSAVQRAIVWAEVLGPPKGLP
ncbi:MAG: hypothetical protein AMS21_08735 [Gemmatimonas sp. SG8_38_2]|nr:MAG: hypothetical protein AMS21_08735 [Gemmatimonas sp. SG8_38_2]